MRSALLAAGTYAVLILALTYPQVLELYDTTLGEPNVDKLNNLWDFWWWWKAATEPGLSAFFSDHVNYPPGVDLWRSNSGFLLYLTSLLPWALLGDLEATYNVMVMLSMLASCLGGYFLGVRLFEQRGIAFYLGAATGFNALTLLQIQVAIPEFVNLGWAMLFLGSLVRLQERRDLASVGVSWFWYAVAATWAWYIGFLLLGLAGLFFLIHVGPRAMLTGDRRLPAMAVIWAMGIGAFTLAVHQKIDAPGAGGRFLPVQRKVIAALESEEVRLTDEFGVLGHEAGVRRVGLHKGSDRECVDAFELKLTTSVDLPGAMGAWDPGHAMAPLWPMRWIVPFFLAVLALWRLRRRRTLFYAALFLCTTALALGPCLVLDRRVIWGSCALTPFSLLGQLVPGVSRMQFPYRLLFPAVIGLLVCSGYGLRELVAALPAKGWIRAGVIALATALALAGGAGPSIFLRQSHPNHALMRSSVGHPGFYDQLARSGEDFALLEVPFGGGEGVRRTYPLSRYAFYQTVHDKRQFSSPIPRYLAPRTEPPGIRNNPLLHGLSRILAGEEQGPLDPAELKTGLAGLRRYSYRYIILHQDDLTPGAFVLARSLLSVLPGKPSRDASLPSDRLWIYGIQ